MLSIEEHLTSTSHVSVFDFRLNQEDTTTHFSSSIYNLLNIFNQKTSPASSNMASFPIYNIPLLAIAILLISPIPSSFAASTPQTHFTKIYAFGDSYTDTGNVKSSLPYGITYFHHPANRLSDGRLVIDFVSEALSLPYLPPYLDQKADKSHGVNFAVGGATAIDHEFYVKNNITLNFTPQSIKDQLVWFKKFLASRGCRGGASRECNQAMDGALFWFGQIGANDYAYTFGSSVSQDTVQDLAVKTATGVLQELLNMGVKHILVQGLPTTGCLPLALTLAPTNDRDDMGCVASANKRSYSHNSVLQSNLQNLRQQHPRVIISYADHWNAYRTVMLKKQRYGFREPFKACCGSGGGTYNFELFAPCGSKSASKACSNPEQYINWDGVHLTEAMYKAVAEMFIHQGYCHPAFDTLLMTGIA